MRQTGTQSSLDRRWIWLCKHLRKNPALSHLYNCIYNMNQDFLGMGGLAALAGTRELRPEDDAARLSQELLGDPKEAREHALVAEDLKRVLASIAGDEDRIEVADREVLSLPGLLQQTAHLCPHIGLTDNHTGRRTSQTMGQTYFGNLIFQCFLTTLDKPLQFFVHFFLSLFFLGL